jgi:hypothetical protein
MKRVTNIARGFTHLVKWVDYHSGPADQPSGRPARVTFYSSRPDGGDAAVEGLERLERIA